MRIAMFEGYRRRPRRKRRSYRGVTAQTKARRKLFGIVAKTCLVKSAGLSQPQKKACMKVGLAKGVEAARRYVK